LINIDAPINGFPTVSRFNEALSCACAASLITVRATPETSAPRALLPMKITGCVASIRRHLDNAGETVDRETKALEETFARMFLERLRLECAGLTDEELKTCYPDAHKLLKHGLPYRAMNVRQTALQRKSA
jgi:hypothetical protein